MEENKDCRGSGKNVDYLGSRFTNFIRSSRVQNVIAVVMFLFIVQMYCKFSMMLLSDVDVDPEVAYWERQAFYYHTFSTLGYTAIFLFVNVYRITTISDLELKILKFSQKLYSKETSKLCFEPLLADWKKEYNEAIANTRIVRAIWISIKYLLAFFAEMIKQTRVVRFFDVFRER